MKTKTYLWARKKTYCGLLAIFDLGVGTEPPCYRPMTHVSGSFAQPMHTIDVKL